MVFRSGLAYMFGSELALSNPSSMAVSFGTAYQSPDTTYSTVVSIMIETTYTITIANTQADEVELRVGPDATSVANGSGGNSVASFKSSLTGIALSVGMGTVNRQQMVGFIPPSWYFAVRRLVGSVAIIQAASWQSMS